MAGLSPDQLLFRASSTTLSIAPPVFSHFPPVLTAYTGRAAKGVLTVADKHYVVVFATAKWGT